MFQIVKKIVTVIKIVNNWPAVLSDKLGFSVVTKYWIRTGQSFICRSKSSDINIVVELFSGAEYPKEYLRFSSKNQVVFDLGANIGAFSVYFDSLNKGVEYSGYSIEPEDQNFRLLIKNLSLNKVENFKPVKAAITRKDGEVFLNTHVKQSAVSVVETPTDAKVKSHKLSTFCRENMLDRVDILKMDVEGSEYDIIETDRDFFRSSVASMILEYHNISPEKNAQAAIKLLEKDFEVRSVRKSKKGGVLYCVNRNL
ncbi:MAG: hypothetical protein COT91_00705 [Candidatus Doudnabacteria bacterium CG10_big_fil_rev_8_21_14_0_10_41_10]|uniref:Methyltransferase FkbM domain-containing protein n=1 Tax=Candidatus Doudnabacteria bacterium CG10_big_fil_rev_8_21_14_0_10_41_10 TaxID=1974551 RepID=A0A2H0VEQ2_9BACT|nr:MAG: hypothetical protein COT91_00705 [Candidatus Doudnabacteria bacterium CG10_big_fil_rev_8_21_14_0_10_41_10]